MVEPEIVLARRGRRIGFDELSSHERRQVRTEVRPFGLGEEHGDGAQLEVASFDGGPLEHNPLAPNEARDTGGQNGLDARRQLALAPLGQRGDELFEKERVALRRLDDSLGVHPLKPALGEGVDQLARGGFGKLLEDDQRAVRVRGGPRGTCLEQLGPRQAEEEDRCARAEGNQVLEQVDEHRLGPVHVLDDRDERPVAGHCLEEAPNGPENLLGRSGLLREADRRPQPPGDELGLSGIVDQLGDASLRLLAGELLHDLDQGVIGDALAVREAAPDRDRGGVADLGEQLLGEPRLADARRADDRAEAADPLVARPREPGAKLIQLALPSHERRRRTDELLLLWGQLEQAPGPDLLAPTLYGKRLQRLRTHVAFDQPVRSLAEQDFVRFGYLLQTRGDVDGIARDEGPMLGAGVNEDVARVDAELDGEVDPPRSLQLLAELGQGRTHLDGRAAGTQGIVLVHDRYAEDGHHRVADELLHRAPVTLDDRPHPLEVAG